MIANLEQFKIDQKTGNLSYGKKFIEFIRNYEDGSQIAVTWDFGRMVREMSMYDVMTDTVLTSDSWPIACEWEDVAALYEPGVA